MAVLMNLTWKNGKGKQYHLPYNFKAAGKNIKWGKGGGDGNFGEENQDFKNWGRMNSKHTPLVKCVKTLFNLPVAWLDLNEKPDKFQGRSVISYSSKSCNNKYIGS